MAERVSGQTRLLIYGETARLAFESKDGIGMVLDPPLPDPILALFMGGDVRGARRKAWTWVKGLGDPVPLWAFVPREGEGVFLYHKSFAQVAHEQPTQAAPDLTDEQAGAVLQLMELATTEIGWTAPKGTTFQPGKITTFNLGAFTPGEA